MKTRRIRFLSLGAYASVVCWVALLLPMQACGMMRESGRSEQRGNFELRHVHYEGFGHHSTRASLYHRGHFVSDHFQDMLTDPFDEERILFSALCTNREPQECGTFYFDGHREQRFRIHTSFSMHFPDTGHDSPWTLNGKYVVVDVKDDLVLVDLESGASLNAGQRIRDAVGGDPQIEFRGWAPDREQVAVAALKPRPGAWESDLIAVHAPSRQFTYVGTASPRILQPSQYRWQATESGGWRLILDEARIGKQTFYEKDPPPFALAQ